MTNDPDHEPQHALSPTGHILEELALYGHRPFDDEPDPRPLPEAHLITGAIVDIFDALAVTMQDTRLEPDLETLLWGQVNLFHRTVDRIERELDDEEISGFERLCVLPLRLSRHQCADTVPPAPGCPLERTRPR